MNWYFLFYLFSVVDKLSASCFVLALFSGLAYVLTFAFIENSYPNERDLEQNERLRRYRPYCLWFGLSLLLISVVTPSRKDILLIIAGGAVGNFVTSDSSSQAIPADITRFLRGQILKASSDLKEDILLDGERDKMQQLTKDELVNLLMQHKSDSLSKP